MAAAQHAPLELTAEQIAAYVADLETTIKTSSLPARRAALRSVIARLRVFPDYLELTYRVPGA